MAHLPFRLMLALTIAGAAVASTADAVPISDARLIAGVKHEVVKELKDPESVRLRDVRVIHDNDGSVVCGELNAENSFGAYVGFRPFYGHLKCTDSMKYFSAHVQGVGDEIQIRVFPKMWLQFCDRH